MDQQTIASYNESAGRTAALYDTLVPESLYRLIGRFFVPDAFGADVGCGSGRDTYWMLQQGYRVVGIDAAAGMLSEARRRYPRLPFVRDSLPLLNSVRDGVFTNLLCSAVLMHLPADEVEPAVENLLRVTVDDGVVLVSFRHTDSSDQRENGKLYTPVAVDGLVSAFAVSGAALLYRETSDETGRGLEWHNLVFKKSPRPAV